MKLKKKSDRSLESFAVFPYVAWGVTLLFAVFVYNLATDLQETADRLQVQTEALQIRIDTPPTEITDFES